MTPFTAILIPSLNRPHLLAGLVDNIEAATPEPHEILFAVSDDASVNILARAAVRWWRDDGRTWPERINFLASQTLATSLFLGSDDLLFHRWWLTMALAEMDRTGADVVAVNDLFNPHGTSCLVRHPVQVGQPCTNTQVVHEGYRHNYADTELFERAKAAGQFAYCAESIVEHLHWAAGKAPYDDTYARSDAHTDHDRLTFNSRRHLWAFGS